jgi:hypothetical protein
VHGIPDPTPEDNPTHGRASSLMYYKKAILYFMTNKLMPWDAIRREVPTICKFQFNLNARLDDTCHMKYDFINPCPQFPVAVLCNVRWSKSLLEERDCPDQIMMGAMDPHYCISLTLAIYLEMWLGSGDALLNPVMFGDYRVDQKTTKTWVRKIIHDKVV